MTDLREKIASEVEYARRHFEDSAERTADRILALLPIARLSEENAHLRERCTWLQERRTVLRNLLAAKWSKRKAVRRMRAKLAAGPVMPEVPSEAVQVLIIDTVNNAIAGRGNWSCYGLYVDIRTALLKEQSR